MSFNYLLLAIVGRELSTPVITSGCNMSKRVVRCYDLRVLQNNKLHGRKIQGRPLARAVVIVIPKMSDINLPVTDE
ncbi:MAG: hypothetical protein ACRDSL_25375 [Pseudonocardiaceae bacterium]